MQLEGEKKPGIVFGISSDRIGTEEGKYAYFTTFSKQIGDSNVAPYVVLNYSETDRGLNFPFGASVALRDNLILIPMYDGHQTHTTLTFYGRKGLSVTLIAAWNRRFGLSVGKVY